MLNLTSFLKHLGQIGFEVSVFGMWKKDECKKECKNIHPITNTIIFIVKIRQIQSRCICCFYQQNNCRMFLLKLYKWILTKQYGGKDKKRSAAVFAQKVLFEKFV